VAGNFEIVSLTVGRIATLSNPLKLQVPNRNNQSPKVRVRSFPKNYQLDPLNLNLKGSRYQFQWSDFVLKRENINPTSLRATAFVNEGQLIYLPVIFSTSAGQYDIIVNANSRAKISEFKILQNNKTIYSTSRPNFQPKGQIPFTWNGRTSNGNPAPAGLYQLRVTAQLEQDDAPPRPASINITFAHNPQWLQ
jgi:flagellar basal-body rod modification protein FlgD